LKANNIPYVAYDVEKDKEAAARKKELSGRSGVPFAVINGKKIYGYSEDAYARALGIKGRTGQP
jgi:glutaredoxin